MSDKWFRWCFNIFVFLMCAQLGFILTLKNIYRNAEKRMQKNEAQVDFKCGDFNKENSYWSLPNNRYQVLTHCLDEDCPESLWVNSGEQDSELHVISVEKPRPTQWVDGEVQHGYFVNVKVKASEKPITLVLVSQSLMQWNIQNKDGINAFKAVQEREPASEENPLQELTAIVEEIESPNIKEVIVVGPELVWLDGISDQSKVTYFNKNQLCAFPTAWEEIKNPENQFRRFFSALKAYTGLEVTSFQGKIVGREFKIPFRNILAEERSMHSQIKQAERGLTSDASVGLQ